MAHVAIVCSNNSKLGETGHITGSSLIEIAHVVFELEQAHHRFDFLSPLGGEIPLDPNTIDFSDPIARDYYERKTFLDRLQNSLPIDQMLQKHYSAVIVCGGWGCVQDFLGNQKVERALLEHWPHRVIGFVGHATCILLGAEFIRNCQGLKITAPSQREDTDVGFDSVWPLNLDSELTAAKYTVTNSLPWVRNVVVAGSLVTGQNSFSAQAVGESIVKELNRGNVA